MGSPVVAVVVVGSVVVGSVVEGSPVVVVAAPVSSSPDGAAPQAARVSRRVVRGRVVMVFPFWERTFNKWGQKKPRAAGGEFFQAADVGGRVNARAASA